MSRDSKASKPSPQLENDVAGSWDCETNAPSGQPAERAPDEIGHGNYDSQGRRIKGPIKFR
jgi:hypothetical protein